MNIMLIIIIGIFSMLFLAGGILIYFRMRKGNAFEFLVFSRDGKHIDSVKANVRFNTNGIKEFHVPKHDVSFDMKPPQIYLNNKPFRCIAYDIKGDLQYIEPKDIDTENYLKYAMTIEEKKIALLRLKEGLDLYGQGMDKWQAITLISLVILCVIIVLGAVFSVYQNSKTASIVLENSEEITKASQITSTIANTHEKVSENLALIVAALTNDKNLTRRLS